jgi:TDG/mug DNA glycosylase family protein
MSRDSKPRLTRADWEHLRLTDRVRPGVRVLFVGINPGVRSALTGHHFAGYSNRFWKLLHEAGLVPRAVTCQDDVCLPDWGYGITNLVARPSPGIDDLKPAEYFEARDALVRKIRRIKPEVVALVGVTLHRALFSERRTSPIPLGLQDERLGGARVFVLPNPSGRNANYSYSEMLAAFRALAAATSSSRRRLSSRGSSPPRRRSRAASRASHRG